MSDLIDRVAAIDAAKKLLDYYGTNDISKEYADHTAKRFMNRVPSAQQWIPCSERLPEESGEYQITWTTSCAPPKRFIGDSEYEVTSVWDEERNTFKGEWLLDAYIQAYPDVKVIAWMPLPEPYREG